MTSGNTGAWTEKIARFGFVATGVIYGLIGVLAVASVVTGWGSTGGSQNAVETIDNQPFGAVLLGIIGVGLFAYAGWQLFRAIVDPEQTTEDDYGALKRVGYGASAFVHGALGVNALQLALGSGGGGGSTKETILTKLLGMDTFGEAIVTVAGVLVVGYGLYEARKGVTQDFTSSLRRSLSNSVRRQVVRAGTVGLIARGAVFTLIGASLIRAGVSGSVAEYEGVGEVLGSLSQQPLGATLLVVTAVGLALYGGYQVSLAKFRRIPSPS